MKDLLSCSPAVGSKLIVLPKLNPHFEKKKILAYCVFYATLSNVALASGWRVESEKSDWQNKHDLGYLVTHGVEWRIISFLDSSQSEQSHCLYLAGG